jgi:hypothetical protein
MKTVRCKFRCDKLTKMKGWVGREFIYEYEFAAVSSGSPENEAFYAASPGGHFKVYGVVADHFEVGQEYYFDITPAVSAE